MRDRTLFTESVSDPDFDAGLKTLLSSLLFKQEDKTRHKAKNILKLVSPFALIIIGHFNSAPVVGLSCPSDKQIFNHHCDRSTADGRRTNNIKPEFIS
jgi:hypothetical protein